MKRNLRKIWAAAIGTAMFFGTLPAMAKGPAKSSGGTAKFSEDGYREAIASNDYNSALGMLKSVKQPSVAQQIDQGLLQHYLGDYKSAAATLEKASSQIGDYFAAELKDDGSKKGSAGAMVSETAAPYKGNIYEYLLIDALNALNYYKNNDIESAYSRVQRVSDKQQEYGAKFSYLLKDDEESNGQNLDKAMETLKAAGLSVNGDPRKVLPAKPTEQDIYKTSAFVNYLQMVLGAQNGSEVDEYIVRELKTLAPNVETNSASLAGSNGRIEVIALTGTIAQRAEHKDESVFFPFPEIGNVKFKYVWPEYKKGSSNAPTVVSITLNNGASKKAVLLEDFDKAVEKDVKLNARKAAWRSIVRSTTTKASAAAGAAAGVSKAKNDVLKMAAVKGAQKSLDAVDLKEVADIRQSIAIPSKAYCTGFDVAPGTYSVTVKYSNGATETIENIVVKAGKPILVESLCK